MGEGAALWRATPTSEMYGTKPSLLILNQMAGPMTWQLAEDFADAVGPVALLTGHPDTLRKAGRENVLLFASNPQSKGNYPRRFWSWLKYCLHACWWVSRWPRSTPMLVFSTPPMLPWVACMLRLVRGHRYAVMVHDVYPDVLVGLRKLPDRHVITDAWRVLNRLAYERAEVVATLGEHMARRLYAAFNTARTAAGRVEVIGCWADTAAIRPVAKDDNPFAAEFQQIGKLTVMYSGNMGFSHDVETMLAAAEQLKADARVHFMFIGAGPQWQHVADTVGAKRLSNVTVLPWQPEQVLPFSLAAADVAFVSLKTELAGTMVPSKAFSFMAAGAPLLISSADQSELADLAARYPLGWRITPGDADGFRDLVLKLADGENLEPYRAASRAAAEEIASRGNSHQLVALLSSTFGFGRR